MKIVRIIAVAVFMLSAIIWGFGKFYTKNMDKVPPVIMADSQEIHVSTKADEAELKKGLTATDNVDGDLTADIVVANLSHFTKKGVCKIQYVVFDESNNVGYYERTVYFDDYESPRIDLTAPLMYVQNKVITLSDRIIATDCLEGNISDKLRFSSAGVSTNETGVYELYVEVRNSYGDVVKEKLLINIVPYEKNIGHIELEDYLIYVSVGDVISPEEYIKEVVDSEGEVVSLESVIISKEVDTSKSGTGQFRYEIKDKNGNIAAITYLAVIVTE